jgi:hypothetical protein
MYLIFNMNNTFEHNRNILNRINSFNLSELVRHNAPRNNKKITNLNLSNLPPKQIKYRIQEHNALNAIDNCYKGIAHIDYVKKNTPPYYGLHETGSGSISYITVTMISLNKIDNANNKYLYYEINNIT